jgi:hypothetical protein
MALPPHRAARSGLPPDREPLLLQHAPSLLSEGDALEEAAAISRRLRNPMWTLDRGSGFYHEERQKNGRAYLVETGRCAVWRTRGAV